MSNRTRERKIKISREGEREKEKRERMRQEREKKSDGRLDKHKPYRLTKSSCSLNVLATSKILAGQRNPQKICVVATFSKVGMSPDFWPIKGREFRVFHQFTYFLNRDKRMHKPRTFGA